MWLLSETQRGAQVPKPARAPSPGQHHADILAWLLDGRAPAGGAQSRTTGSLERVGKLWLCVDEGEV